MDMTVFWCFALGALALFLITEVPFLLSFLMGAGTGALCGYVWAQGHPWWAAGAFLACVLVGALLFGGRGGRGGGGGDLADGIGDVVDALTD